MTIARNLRAVGHSPRVHGGDGLVCPPAFIAVEHCIRLELAHWLRIDPLDVPLRQVRALLGQLPLQRPLLFGLKRGYDTGDVRGVGFQLVRKRRVISHMSGDGIEQEDAAKRANDIPNPGLDHFGEASVEKAGSGWTGSVRQDGASPASRCRASQ